MAQVTKLNEKHMQKMEEINRIFDIAVDKAIAENRRLGIPMYREIDGVAHWELPDGTLTTEDPWPAIEAAKAAQPSKP